MNRFRSRKPGVIYGLMAMLLGGALASNSIAQTRPAAAQASTYSPPAGTKVLGTTFVDWDSLPVRNTQAGQQRAVFDNPTPTLEKFECHITTLRPGAQSHPPHHHAWEEMLLVKEGDVEVSINGQKHRAGPGYLIFFASHDVHNLTNVGDKPATYYVINFYTELVHTVADKPAAEQGVAGMFPSSVIDCNSKPATTRPTGSSTTVFNSPSLTFRTVHMHITMLNVGQVTQADMIDNGDELFIVKQGQVEVTVNGITSRMNEGSLVYCAPNDKRTLRNIGATPTAYQVIKIISDKTPKQAGG